MISGPIVYIMILSSSLSVCFEEGGGRIYAGVRIVFVGCDSSAGRLHAATCREVLYIILVHFVDAWPFPGRVGHAQLLFRYIV